MSMDKHPHSSGAVSLDLSHKRLPPRENFTSVGPKKAHSWLAEASLVGRQKTLTVVDVSQMLNQKAGIL